MWFDIDGSIIYSLKPDPIGQNQLPRHGIAVIYYDDYINYQLRMSLSIIHPLTTFLVP